MKKSLLSFLIVILSFAAAHAQPAGWSYSKAYSITNSGSVPVTNYSFAVIVNTQALIVQGKMQANGADILFGYPCTGSTLLNFYLDTGINTTATRIFVNVDVIPANSTKTIYMFYGNPTATSASSFSAFSGPFTIFGNQTMGSFATTGCCTTGMYEEYGPYFQPNQLIVVTAVGAYLPVNSYTNRIVNLSNMDGTPSVIASKGVSGAANTWNFTTLDTPKALYANTHYAVTVSTNENLSDYYNYSSNTLTNVASQINLIGIADAFGLAAANLPPTSFFTTTGYTEGDADIKFYTSSPANSNITVLPDTAINAAAYLSPANQLVCPGQRATFTATAGGLTPTYQWQVNSGSGWSNINPGAPYSGINSPTLTIAPAAASMAGYQYRTYMTSNCGTGYSAPATLNINTAPFVTPQTTITGANPACSFVNNQYTLNTNVIGGSYQWYVNGVAAPGATGTSYSYHPAGGDQVYAVVTAPNNAALACYTLPEAVSNAINVTTGSNFIPVDSISASNNNGCPGAIVDLTGYTNVAGGTYQWQLNSGSSWVNIPGATASTYSYAPSNGDQVRQIVNTPANGCYSFSSVTSQPVVLTTLSAITPILNIGAAATAHTNTQVTVYANVANAGSNYTIQWYNGGVFLDSTHNINTITYTHTLTTDHIYAYIYPQVQAGGVCYSSARSNDITIGTPTGVAGVNGGISRISAYPNPFSGIINVKGLKKGDNVSVYDMLGRRVSETWSVDKSTGESSFAPGALAPGHYLLHVTDADGNAKANVAVEKQ